MNLIQKSNKVSVTRSCLNSVLIWFEERLSDWTRMRRIIEIVLKYGQILKQKLSPLSDIWTTAQSGVVDIELLEKASIKIIKMLQQTEFTEELKIIKKAYKQNPSNNWWFFYHYSLMLQGCFFTCTARLWSSLPIEYFSLTYVDVVVCKSVTKSSATIFYLVIKTTFNKYFYNIY